MRVGIDATHSVEPRTVGIARFVTHLLRELRRSVPPERLYLYFRPRALRHPASLRRVVRSVGGRVLFEPLARFAPLDVFHATYQRLPRWAHAGYLGSLHDVYYATEGRDGARRTAQRWQERYRDVVARSRLVLTLSEFSRAEIVGHLGAEPAKVRVVPLAAAESFRPRGVSELAAAREAYGLEGPYVLFVGGFARRKNLPGALRTFALALPRIPADVLLAVAGGGRHGEEPRRLVRELGLDKRVRFLGYVPETDYPALVAGALFLFFPSRFEGFGLPPLEAMASGTPVLASSTTAVPEVTGDAAFLVDPDDEASMARAFVELATDARLRSELVARGLLRARSFSWKRVGRQVLGLYEEIARP
ncbi:MAG: glycosyl transferase family 1 [Candidatus Binatia bacterium]|nr:MAG: glycosyl transferase family 1 [Candidatus Binatia bacterium]